LAAENSVLEKVSDGNRAEGFAFRPGAIHFSLRCSTGFDPISFNHAPGYWAQVENLACFPQGGLWGLSFEGELRAPRSVMIAGKLRNARLDSRPIRF